mgnify:FL=1
MRLFLALSSLLLLAIAAFMLLRQQSFREGLLGYLNAQDQARVERALPSLQQEYREFGWRRLIRQPPRLLWLIEGANRPLGEEMPPPPRPPRGPMPWPEAIDGHAGDGMQRPPRPRPPLGRDGDLGPRLQLVDAEGRLLFGAPGTGPGDRVYNIEVDGALVGQLRLRPLRQLSDRIDLAFAEAQRSSGRVIAVSLVLAALLLSFWLARLLVRPIRALAAGAGRLAAGDYSARVDSHDSSELGDLARDFNALAQALERNRHARQRWMAEISHELRTPVAILQAELSALEDGVRPLDRQAVSSLLAEAERLARLVEDLYQLSLSDQGALSYAMESIEVEAMLDDVLARESERMRAAGLSLQGGPREPHTRTLRIRGDRRRLDQLWSNLAANVRRYTDAPGQVHLHWQVQGNEIEVTFEDSPPGVPDAALSQLFDPLFRVDSSRNRAAGGAGLGLAICRNIVEAHGGRIEARHSALGGLAVVLRLPLETAR